MKRITLIILAAAAIIAGSVSCSKVNDIDKRLTQLEQTVSDLKAQVLAGAVITSVEKIADGCTFTLSNGQSYTVTNGKNGTDGEAIIADVKIEEDFVILTLKDGEILRISYQNPLSMVTLSIVPDYDDGTVKEPKTTETMGTKSHNFYLDVAVTPAKYAEILADTERFIHKAVFSPVQTKSDFGNAFTAIPKGVTYMAGAPVPFLQASFEFDDETAAVLQSSAYTVSYSIEDKDGVHGAATAFVALVSNANSEGDVNDFVYTPPTEALLHGVFTVGKNGNTYARVQFSRGMLYCNAKDPNNVTDWGFEVAQFERGELEFDVNPKHLNQFSWSNKISEAVTLNNSSASGATILFTENNPSISIESQTGWHCPTREEWDYLIFSRSAPSFSKGSVVVNDGSKIPGLFLFPDESYSRINDLREIAGDLIQVADNSIINFDICVDLQKFHQLETSFNIVFLPASENIRLNLYNYQIPYYGTYFGSHSSVADDFPILFMNDMALESRYVSKTSGSSGHSIRLVKYTTE